MINDHSLICFIYVSNIYQLCLNQDTLNVSSLILKQRNTHTHKHTTHLYTCTNIFFKPLLKYKNRGKQKIIYAELFMLHS